VILARPLILAAIVLTACGPGETGSDSVSVAMEGGFRVARLPVTSFYHDTEEHPAEYWQSTFYLETDGDNVIVNNMRGPLIEIDGDGYFVRTIGRIGEGPGEYGSVCFGVSAREDSVVVIDDSSVVFFEDGSFQRQITYRQPETFHSTNPFRCRSFDVGGGKLLIPWPRETRPGQIATVCDLDGKPEKTVIDDVVDTRMLELSPWSQSTHWRYEGGLWYCAYMFQPRIAVFDERFEKLGDIRFESPETIAYERDFYASDRSSVFNPRRNIPLFFSFQVRERTGYLMAQGLLHEIDLESGELVGLYRFYAPDHPEIGKQPYYNFPFFAVLDGDRIVMATPGGNLDGELFATVLATPAERAARATDL